MTQIALCESIKTAFRSLVEEHGGAIAVTEHELIEAIQDEDPSLHKCPRTLLQRATVALQTCDELASRGFIQFDNTVRVIYDRTKMSFEEASAKVREDGLSDTVKIALAEHNHLSEALAAT